MKEIEAVNLAKTEITQRFGQNVELLDVSFRSRETKKQSFLSRVKSNNPSEAFVQEAQRQFDASNAASQWQVNFVVFNPRFKGGCKLAIVTVNDNSKETRLVLLERNVNT